MNSHLQDKNHHNELFIVKKKALLRTMLLTIIILAAVLLSSLGKAEPLPSALLDSLNSNKVIYFDFGKYDLKEESIYLLDRLTDRLNHNKSAKIEITGHTDNVGSEIFNNDLSQKRADAVKQYLVLHGVDESQIITKGEGFKKPFTDNITDEHRALNRRVEFKWIQQINETVVQKESDETFANTGLWKSNGNELTGQLSVRDSSGDPITDITENDVSAVLKWKQNEIPDSTDGTVKLFPIDDQKKIAFTFTMDYSPSMYDDQFNYDARKTEKIIQMEKAVLTFIDKMDERHFGKVIKFGAAIDEIIRFTKSKDQMRNSIGLRCYPRAGTALYKSVYFALRDTTYNSNPTIMKTVIAFTDGEENSSGRITKDSIYRISDQSGVKVYTVGLIDEDNHSTPVGLKGIGEADLVEISKRTGGFYYWAKDPAILPLIYEQIYEQIMKSYNISILWNGNNLPPKGTPVTAMVRVNVKGMMRTIYKNYVME